MLKFSLLVAAALLLSGCGDMFTKKDVQDFGLCNDFRVMNVWFHASVYSGYNHRTITVCVISEKKVEASQ
jgi:hypothetical protein